MMSQSFHRFPRRRARMPERTAGLVEHFFLARVSDWQGGLFGSSLVASFCLLPLVRLCDHGGSSSFLPPFLNF